MQSVWLGLNENSFLESPVAIASSPPRRCGGTKWVSGLPRGGLVSGHPLRVYELPCALRLTLSRRESASLIRGSGRATWHAIFSV